MAANGRAVGRFGRRFRRWLRRAPRSLSLRLTIPFALLVTVVMLALGVWLGDQAHDVYRDRLSGELYSQAVVIADRVEREMALGTGEGGLQALVGELAAKTGSRITLVAPDGTVIADSGADAASMGNHANRPEVIEAPQRGRGEAEGTSRTLATPYLYIAVATEADPPIVVRLAVSLDGIHTTVQTMQRAIWFAAGIALALSIVLAPLMTERIVRPLQELREQARAVAKGGLAGRVEPDSTLEIGDVGRAFNTMTSRLAASRIALERTSMRMEAVLAGLSDGVVLTDANGLVLRLNAAAASMFGVAEARAIGRPFVQVCRDHELEALLQAALAGGEQAPRLAAVEHGLNRRTLLTTAHAVASETERLGLVILRDISELRRLETVRWEFVANVSHELRTPLTSIRALVETLESGVVDDPAMRRDLLSRILGEVERLNALVEDLLDLARLEAGRASLRKTTIDAGQLVRQGVERLRPQIDRAQLRLEVMIADGMPTIEVDVARIEQVLLNLVHNAVKFTPPDGLIAVHAFADAEKVAVEVRDTGIGIAQEDQARLFERFYKSDRARRSEGTGLGLAIAKHIVQAHSGEISVISAAGEGATFRFTLPVRPATSPRSWRLPSA